MSYTAMRKTTIRHVNCGQKSSIDTLKLVSIVYFKVKQPYSTQAHTQETHTHTNKNTNRKREGGREREKEGSRELYTHTFIFIRFFKKNPPPVK